MRLNLQAPGAAVTRHLSLCCRYQRQWERLSSSALPFVAAIMLGLWLGLAPASSVMAGPAAQVTPPAAVARFNNVSIYSGPGANYPIIGTIAYGQGCTAAGRDTITGWWLVQCSTGATGWVAYDSVNLVGDSSLVPLFIAGNAPAPTPLQLPSRAVGVPRTLPIRICLARRCLSRMCRMLTSTGALAALDPVCRPTIFLLAMSVRWRWLPAAIC